MEWFPFLLVGVIAVVAIGAVAMHSIHRKKRTEAWQQTAEELGIQFLGTGSDANIRLERMKTFSKGRSRRWENALMADAGDVRITLGDYRYTTGSGKNSHTHRQTICVVESERLDLSHCFLRPQVRFFDAIGAMLGGQDIDFSDDPAFSGAYVLQGNSESAVRKQFNKAAREWFAQRRDSRFHFEGQGGAMIFHNGKLRKPGEVRQMMQEALEILRVLDKGATEG